jgi:hypothetical protein
MSLNSLLSSCRTRGLAYAGSGASNRAHGINSPVAKNVAGTGGERVLDPVYLRIRERGRGKTFT